MNSSLKYFAFGLAAILTLSGCGTTTSSQSDTPAVASSISTATSSVASLTPSGSMSLSEQDFLRAYAAVRSTFNEATPDHFLSLVDTSSSPPEQFEMFKKNWNNQEAKKTWTFFLPELTQFPRLDYRESGDWVAYYYERPSDEAQSIDINIMRMHRLNGEWKLSLNSGASAIPDTSDKQARKQAIQREIETSDVLTVEAK